MHGLARLIENFCIFFFLGREFPFLSYKLLRVLFLDRVMLFFPTKDIPNLSRIISSLWIVRCTQIMGAIILKSGAGVLRKYYRDACRDKLCRDK